MTLDATAYRDSSSEKTTLGSVARRRRCGRPGEGKEPPLRLVGERCVSASCRFSSESGLLRFECDGVGMAKNDLPMDGPDCLAGGEA